MRTRIMMSLWFIVLLLMGTVLLNACGGATSSSDPGATEAAPASGNEESAVIDAPAVDAAAIDAEALLSERCVVCHSLSRVTRGRLTQAQWQEVVTQMIRQGAVLNSDEEAALVAYLAETYKP
jgi:cytochrome c5